MTHAGVSRVVRAAAGVAAAFVAAAGCQSPPAPADVVTREGLQAPAAVPVGPVGRIQGTVRLKGERPAPAFEFIDKDREVCGTEVAVTRLKAAANGGVGNTFVYLYDAPATGFQAQREVVPVEQTNCAYAPHAVAVRTGTNLDISNGDPILHNVHAKRITSNGLQTVFNIAQPVRGQRTLVEPPLTHPGIVTLTCEAGHPWMTAYILVADHPYTAVTAPDGTFTIPDVPAGTYQIRMWHEGVRLTRVLKSVQQYEFEEPYEVTREVVVSPDAPAQVDFELALR